MTTLDFILLAIIVVSALYGYHKGIVAQIGALAGVLVGIFCCRMFSDDFASLLNDVFLDSTSTKASSLFLNSVIAQVVLFLVGYFSIIISNVLTGRVLARVSIFHPLKGPPSIIKFIASSKLISLQISSTGVSLS